MVYRTSARDLENDEDAIEVRSVALQTRRRRRWTAVFVSIVTVSMALTPFVFAALHPPTTITKCHNVSLQWENAPEIPPNEWRACRQVIVP